MSAKQRQPANPVKDGPAKQPATHTLPVPATITDDDTDLLSDEDREETQLKIDQSITRELEGVGHEIGGVRLRPLSMSAVMRLHEVGNEIMAGKKVMEMSNPVYAAAEFLFSLALENDIDLLVEAAFGPRNEWRKLVAEWAETVAPSDTLVSDVIDFINNTTSTRVKARLPKAMKGSTSEGNGSLHHGL